MPPGDGVRLNANPARILDGEFEGPQRIKWRSTLGRRRLLAGLRRYVDVVFRQLVHVLL